MLFRSFLTLDPNDTIMAMGTGECAMDLQGQWYDGTMIQNDLDPNDYGVFAFPSGDSIKARKRGKSDR